MNLYEYAFGDPVNNIDPSGLAPGYWQQVGSFGLGEAKALAGAAWDFGKSVTLLGGLIPDADDPVTRLLSSGCGSEAEQNGNSLGGGLAFVGSLVTPEGPEAAAGEIPQLSRLPGIRSRIGESPKLIREAEVAGRSVQEALDGLVRQLTHGNMNPGIGSKQIFADVYEARAANGAKVYFRIENNTIEILGKSTKGNQSAVISALRRLYGN